MDRATDFSVFVGLLSLFFVLWVTRKSWARKQCPYCRYSNPALATKCQFCHEWYPRSSVPLVLLVLGSGVWVDLALAQAFQPSSCTRLSFFAEETCTDPVPGAIDVAPSPAPDVPLFTKETVSPYTAPELLHLSNHRTMEHARQYVRRQMERNEATEEVTRLVQQAWQEMGIGHAR